MVDKEMRTFQSDDCKDASLYLKGIERRGLLLQNIRF